MQAMRKRRWFSSLRARLLLLVLAAMVPALALIVHSAVEERSAAIMEVRTHAREIADQAAADENQLNAEFRQLLMTLARLKPISSGGPDEFRRVGGELIRDNPRINNIARVDLKGVIVASVLPLPGTINVADRPYFRRALQSRDFAVGDYQIGRISGRGTLNFAYPIRNDEGSVGSILYASLDLEWLNREAADTTGHVPAGATLTRADRNGVVFAQYPAGPIPLGKAFPIPEVLDAVRKDERGIVEAAGQDGIPRLYVFSRINRPAGSGNACVILGYPRQLIFREGNRLLAIRLSGLGFVMLLGVIATWFGAETAVLDPIRALLDATRRFGEGDLSVRTGISPSEGELGILAAGFDRMAEAIENREHALREAQKLYQTLVSTSPDAITVTDGRGNIIFVSDMALKIYGHDPGETVIGRNLFDWVDPEDRPAASERFGNLLTGGSLDKTEFRLLRRDGSRFVGEIYASPLQNESGETYGLIVATRDVTERIRAADALRESELRLRAAIENLPFEFWACDAGGRFTLANTLAIRKYGDFIGKKMAELETTDGYRSTLDGINRRVVLSGETIRFETEFVLDGVRQTNDNIISPIRDGDAVIGLVSITIDITERKQAEARQEELEAQLRQSQKMEAVGQLAGGIAHDFNNLMIVVLGQVDLVRRRWKEPLLSHHLDEIGKAGERAATLTRQLLAFSRRQILQPRVLDLNGVLEDIRSILDRLLPDNYLVEILAADGLWPVLADPTQIGQVVVNLVVNARDALPDGGSIRVSTANVSIEDGDPDRPPAAREGEYVRLCVRDEGVGMNAATKARLFEPFFTTKEVGKGTGLGLSTAYGIVMQSGGHIRVDSEPGIGTTVCIWLPRAKGDVAPLHPEIPVEPPHGNSTLLLVEDAGHVRDLVRDILEEFGYAVIEAANGAEALSVAAAHDGPIDLLLSDMVMPGMNGRKLADAIRAARPAIKVLFMSGYTEETVFQSAAGEGRTAFIQKPFTPEALGWKIHEVLSA